MNERVYINKLATIPVLEENIRDAIAEIEQHLWESMMENFARRI